MIKYFSLLFSLCIIISCKTTFAKKEEVKEKNYIPYYLSVYKADSLFIAKNYGRSYEVLDSLFQKYEPINMPNYNEVANYYKLKIILKKEIDRTAFSNLISNYDFNEEFLKNDSIISIYYNKEKNNQNYNDLRQTYLASLNLDLRNEIKEMCSQDQLYRDKNYKLNILKQNKIDSINWIKTKNILEKIGYPNENRIGNFMIDKSNVSIEIILLHTNDYDRVNYFMPKILEFMKKGQAPPNAYASMYDQLQLYNGKEQYYGSYNSKNIMTIDMKELNKRRKTIGLPSYGYEKWRLKKLYPDEEY